MSSSFSPYSRRLGCGLLLAVLAVITAGCEGSIGTGGSNETISTGEGQAVIPKQELINLGQTEKELAAPARKAR